MVKLVANVEKFDNHYVAWIENAKMKGMVVEGESAEEVWNELLISLKVKIAYNLGVDISSIEPLKFKSIKEYEAFKKMDGESRGKVKKEINLQMSY